MSVPNAAPTTDRVTERMRPEPGRGRAVTFRSVALGLVMVCVIVGMTQVISIQSRAADVGGGSPPPAPTYFLFLYALLLAPLLGRLGRRFALARGEIMLIYAMMLIAGPITHLFCIGYLIPHTVAPLRYNAEEPGWAVFEKTLPPWFGPTDPKAVAGFFQGTQGAVPWQAWMVPIAAWASLLIALFWVMLCINSLMRRQWVENERLVFPLTAIPIALSGGSGLSAGGRLAPLLRQPLFWLGAAIPLVLQLPTALHRFYPSVPEIPLREILVLNATTQLAPPWKGLGEIYFSLLFWLLGVVYLLPTEIAFSGWFFYLLTLGQNVTAVMFGTSGEAPSVYSNDFPALYAQGAGAAFALAAIALYTARRHLAAVLRKVFRNDPTVEDGAEFISYRTAFFGALLGIAFILGWLCLAGMRFWVACLLFGLILAYFFLFARIRAETGLGMGVILWPKMLDEVMLTFVGAKYLTLADMTVLYSLRWLYFGSATGSVMACQLESFRLVDAGGGRGRSAGRILMLTAIVTVALAIPWTLQTYYNRGFEAMPVAQRGTSMVGSQIYWAYQNFATAWEAPRGPEWPGILAIGAGAFVAIALSWLRMQFLWFPLHPVGYMAANSWGMHLHWITFFIGWLLKVLITRYGGMSVYQRLLPLFLGLIVGDLLHEGLWGLVTWATGGRQ